MNNSEINLLIIDDEDDLRKSIVTFMELEDFKVFSANCAQAALEVIKDNKIHFILSDIRMPGMDGVELLEEIRRRNPEVPVVMLMTGQSEYSKSEIIAKGALDVISKPFDLDIVIETIKKTVVNP